MDMVVPLQHRQHFTLRVIGDPLANALGEHGGVAKPASTPSWSSKG